MSKLAFVLLQQAVTVHGQEITAGNVLELTELSATALVNEGKAEFCEPGPVIETPDTSPEQSATPAHDAGQQTEPDTPKDVETVPGDAEGGLIGSPVKDREAAYAAIDAQYTGKQLRPVAKDAGVDFAYDATKGDVINAVIDQDKVHLVLK